jgi:hypothetical protein
MCLSNKRGQIECANTSWLDAFGFSNADEVKGKTFKLIQGSLTEQKTLVKIMDACQNGNSFTGNLINYTKRRSPVLNELKIDVINDDCFLVASTKVSNFSHVNLLRDVTHYDIEEKIMRKAFNSEIPTCIMSGKVVLDANVHWCKTFNIGSKNDIVNKTTRAIQGPLTETAKISNLMETLLVQNKTFKGTLTNYTLDEQRTPFFNSVEITPLRNNYFVSQTVKSESITDKFPGYSCVLIKNNKIVSVNQELLDQCEIAHRRDVIGYSVGVIIGSDFDLIESLGDIVDGQVIVKRSFLCTKHGMLMSVQSRICKFGKDHILMISSTERTPFYLTRAQKVRYVNDCVLNCQHGFYHENTCVLSLKKYFKHKVGNNGDNDNADEITVDDMDAAEIISSSRSFREMFNYSDEEELLNLGLSDLLIFNKIEDSIAINKEILHDVKVNEVNSKTKINQIKKMNKSVNRYFNCLVSLRMKGGAIKLNIKARLVLVNDYVNEKYLVMVLQDDAVITRMLKKTTETSFQIVDSQTINRSYQFDSFPYIPFLMVRDGLINTTYDDPYKFINVGNVILTHLFSPGALAQVVYTELEKSNKFDYCCFSPVIVQDPKDDLVEYSITVYTAYGTTDTHVTFTIKCTTVYNGPVYISIIRGECNIDIFRFAYLKIWKVMEKIGAAPKSASEDQWMNEECFHPLTPSIPNGGKKRKSTT